MPNRNVEHHVEVVGQQLRIRLSAPAHYKRFYTNVQKGGQRNVRGVTVAGTRVTQSYRLNLSENTRASARQWIKGVPCSQAMKRKARALVTSYYKVHPGDPPIIRYRNGKRLRGHALAVQLNSERTNRARAMDARQTSRHLFRTDSDETIWRWWHAGHGRRSDIAGVDSKRRKAGKTYKK